MSTATGIEWTDATWNPIVGCSVVSPGCTNCYAMTMAARLEKIAASQMARSVAAPTHYAGTTMPSKAGPVWTGEVRMAPDQIVEAPLRWRRPRRIFVNSMGDLFHEAVPDAWIDRVFAVMALAPLHTYQILTKRSARMRAYLSAPDVCERIGAVQRAIYPEPLTCYDDVSKDALWPLLNVWLGVSAEDQRRAAERVPDLLATPAAIRFVSAEPLLGAINFRRLRIAPDHHTMLDAVNGYVITNNISGSGQERTRLYLVIVGGESGARARPMHPDWARSIRDQCADADVHFFFKQWGEWAPRRRAVEKDLFDARKSLIVSPTGATTTGLMTYPADAWVMDRCGRQRAGRLLDGVEHNGMPA